jgi:2-keto-4-pentenoate hydratase
VTLSNIDALAGALIHARRTGNVAQAAPLADALADPADAYAVQQRVARELGWFDGAAPQYW